MSFLAIPLPLQQLLHGGEEEKERVERLEERDSRRHLPPLYPINQHDPPHLGPRIIHRVDLEKVRPIVILRGRLASMP
jgi:hypothetical protein